MTTANDLRHALEHLENRGKSTPCRESAHRERWTSEDADDREWAAHICRMCPVLRECGAAADELKATAGVWAGRDRTPQPRKKKSA